MENLKKFFTSYQYYILVILVAVIFNSLDLGIVGLSILVAFICTALIVQDDFAPIMVTIGACVYALNEYPVTTTYYIVFGVCLAVFVPSLAYFMYKNIKNGIKFRLGKYFWPLVLIVVAYSLGGIFSPYFNFGSFGFGVVISLCALGAYLLVYNFTKTSFKDLAFNLFTVVSVVIILEMWWCYLASGDILSLMQNKGVRVGVGEINLPAMTIGMWIPLLLAKGLNTKHDYLYVLLGLFAFINIIFTFSRGALLFTIIFGLISVIVFFIKTKKKKNISITLGSTLAVIIVGVIVFWPTIIEMMQHYINRGFDDTGRFELYELAIAYFRDYPAFGVGWQVDTYGFVFSQFHSTPLQLLASTGLIGFFICLPHYFQRYQAFIQNGNVYTFFACMCMLICEGYGFIDQTSTFAMSYIYAVILMLASEESKKKNLEVDINSDLVNENAVISKD